MKKKILLILLLVLSACSSSKTIKVSVYKDAKFDCADLNINKENFEENGFELGDSFDISFPDGTVYEDVPYFNGYYVKTGMPVIVAYPKNDYVLIANNNSYLWSSLNLKDNDEVKITLKEKGKYLATQEALGQSYKMDRESYKSDEEFANFRALSGGDLKENYLYRGASPVDNSRNRASYVDKLLKNNNIVTIIDLADNDDDIKNYLSSSDFDSEYAKELYENGKDILLSMSSNFDSLEYKENVGKAFKFLLENKGPAYIHCMEGKDRTGFVCFVIEALMNASYEEMRNDYMLTYQNYYGITLENDPDKYEAIVSLYFDSFVEYLTGKDLDKELNYHEYANDYLLTCGLSQDEIEDLIILLSQ